jgi:sulfate adenylyltransferase subunit 1 (EFTu-like GTPase family)
MRIMANLKPASRQVVYILAGSLLLSRRRIKVWNIKGGQTREHAILARSLGVSQLVVAVNKMDLVGYSEARYNEVVTCLRLYLNKLG